MGMIRMGILGSGFGRAVLRPVFSSLPEVSVVAVTGRVNPEESGMVCFNDWRKLLENSKLDAVAIALPPKIQELAALECAHRGLHLFCEKPLALDPQIAVQIGQALKSQGKVGMIDFEYPKLSAIKKLIQQAGTLKGIHTLEITCQLKVPTNPQVRGSWKYDEAQGGGAMTTFGCHLLNLCTLILGEIKVESYWTRIHQGSKISKDGSAVQVTAPDEFKLTFSGGGATGLLHVNTSHAYDHGIHVQIESESGSLVLRHERPENYFGGFHVWFKPRFGNLISLEEAHENDQKEGRYQAVQEMARSFVESIDSGENQSCNLEEGVQNTQLIAQANRIKVSETP